MRTMFLAVFALSASPVSAQADNVPWHIGAGPALRVDLAEVNRAGHVSGGIEIPAISMIAAGLEFHLEASRNNMGSGLVRNFYGGASVAAFPVSQRFFARGGLGVSRLDWNGAGGEVVDWGVAALAKGGVMIAKSEPNQGNFALTASALPAYYGSGRDLVVSFIIGLEAIVR